MAQGLDTPSHLIKPFMKFFKTFLMLAFLVASLSVSARRLTDTVRSGGPKHESLFVLKAEKQLVGAQVEVFYSNGNLITAQKLQKKKMIIDFTDARLGTYTIRVTKGSKTKDYRYIKK